MSAEIAVSYYWGQRRAYCEKYQGEERRRAQNRLSQHKLRCNRLHHLKTSEDYMNLAADMGKGQKPVRLGRLKDPKRRASQRLKKLHKPSPTCEDDNGSMEPDLEFPFELLDQDPRNDFSIAVRASSDESPHILSDEMRLTSSQQRNLPPYDDAWLDPDYFGPTYSLDADTSAWWTDGTRARTSEHNWAGQLHNFDGSQSLVGTMQHSHASCDANISCSEGLMNDVFGEAQPQTPPTATRKDRLFENWTEQLSDVNRLQLQTIAAELKSRLKKGRLIRSPQSTARQPPSSNPESSTIEEFCHKLREEILRRKTDSVKSLRN